MSTNFFFFFCQFVGTTYACLVTWPSYLSLKTDLMVSSVRTLRLASETTVDAGDVAQQQGRTRSQNAPRTVAGTSGSTTPAQESNPPAQEKTEIKSQATPRSSCRVLKRLRKDASPPPQNNTVSQTASKKTNASKQNAADSGKTRRPWELWSTEDKNSFFEALCEFGKDFESIQSYIAQRSKKKGVPLHGIKNKDQVRHFYYRTWHKISKVMDIGEDVKKQTQELYGLINYAELRKKYSASINERNGQLLTELVLSGSTMVKIKGKRVRIKTPLCRALKKLNNVEDAKDGEPAKLPQEIYVELRPRCNAAWAHVQGLAQNPRVRTKTGLQRRVSTIVEYLQHRWQPLRVKQKEHILSALPSGVASAVTGATPEPKLELRVWPAERICPISISTADSTSNLDISLEGYKKNTGIEGTKCRKPKRNNPKPPVNIPPPQPQPPQAESGDGSSQDTQATSTNPSPPSTLESQRSESNPEEEATKSLTLLQSMLEPQEEPQTTQMSSPQHAAPLSPPVAPTSPPTAPLPPISNVEDLCSSLPTTEDAEKLTLGQLLGLAAEEARGGIEEEEEVEKVEEKEEVKKDEESKEAKEARIAKEEELKERYEKGWSATEAGFMTVGELYLMMGRPTKIVLHYDFEHPEKDAPNRDSNGKVDHRFTTVLKKLVSLASTMFSEKNKQGPMSPPAGRSGIAGLANCSRASGTPPSSKSVASRAIGRSPSARSNPRPTLQQVQEAQVQDSAAAALSTAEGNMTTQPSSAGGAKSDQHVFVVPVGTAPRSQKANAITAVQDAVQEQIDKLIPGNRRGNRMRTNRKPVVVQRPLLPRADQRPVTVVQLLPSPQTLATVVQQQPASSAATPVPATGIGEALQPGSGVVNLLPTGSTFDVHVPLSSASAANMILPVASQVVVTTTSPPLVSSSPMTRDSVMLSSGLPLPVKTLSRDMEESVVSSTVVSVTATVLPVDENANCSEGPIAPVSLTTAATRGNDVSSLPISPPSISSLLDISLPDSLPSDAPPVMPDDNSLLNFAAASVTSSTALTSFEVQSKEEMKSSNLIDSPAKSTLATPPMSPFKLVPSAPDPNWLNGESSDFSLSSLLNTFDSPLKANPTTSSSGCPALSSENSNLDPIARLAPDVDTQLQCLMNENSIDYVAKFADLAAQIASSNVEHKSTT
ncbi:protein cramped-like [Ornithodoros turicata]